MNSSGMVRVLSATRSSGTSSWSTEQWPVRLTFRVSNSASAPLPDSCALPCASRPTPYWSSRRMRVNIWSLIQIASGV